MRIRYSFSSRRTGNIENIKKQREKFPKLVRDMIKVCDVLLEVLDARFIAETRNLEVEDLIKEQGKQILYVLNKSDLTDARKAKKQAQELGLFPFVLVSAKKRRGGRELRNRIKMEVKKLPEKTVNEKGEEETFNRKQVGIIGYPNTGKSSIINLLTGKPAAATSQQSGFTKSIQKVRLSENILVLDTPGVIPESESSTPTMKALAKHGQISVRTYDKVKEPEFVVASLVQKFPNIFEEFYGIKANGNSELLIDEIGRKKNLIKKGNEVDTDRAARIILKDWQEGKIKVD